MQSETKQIIEQLLNVLRRRKRIIAAIAVLCVGGAALYNTMAEPVFESSTSLAFDEFTDASQSFQSDRSQEILTSNRIQELTSRSFALEVAQALSEEDLARFHYPEEVEPGWNRLESVAKAIDDALVAAPVRKSSLIELYVELHDPILCAQVANTAAEVYQDRNLRIKQEGVRGIRQFVEEQLDRFRVQLEESERALRDYKQANNIGSFDDEKKEVLHRLTEAEVLYNAATTDRRTLETRLALVEENLRRTRSQIVPSVTEASSPRLAGLQGRLVELQLRYADLQVQNYPASHPKMLELQRDIKETETSLKREAQSVASGEGIGDPVAQLEKYGDARLDLQIEVSTVKARIEALATVIRGYEATLGRLPDQEMQLVRLTRARDVSQKVYGNLLEKLEDTKISEAENIPSVRIVDHAVPDPNPQRPRKRLNLGIGAVLGLIFGTGVAFAREASVGSVDSLSALEQLTGWPALANVPHVERLPSGDVPRTNATSAGDLRTLKLNLVTNLEPHGAAAEAFRMLRTNLELRGVGARVRTLLVTSSKPDDGKTSIVSNLALSFAAEGRRVLVIDAEVRRPSMHWVFDVPSTPGLAELLTSNVVLPGTSGGGPQDGGENNSRDSDTPAETARDAEFFASLVRGAIHTSPIPNLSVMPAGAVHHDTGNIIAGHAAAMRALLAQTGTMFDVVLLDTPPLTIVHDTVVLASFADGALFVVNSRRPNRDMLSLGQVYLARSEVEVMGAVLNQITPTGVYKRNDYYITRS